MALLYLTQGNTKPRVNFTLKDPSGNPINITGATLEFIFRRIGASFPKFIGVGVIDSGVGGTCHYDWITTDTEESGPYHGQIRVTFPAGEKQSTNLMGFYILPKADVMT